MAYVPPILASNLQPTYTLGKERSASTVEPTPDDIVIAVMGPTGSGKTKFISSFIPDLTFLGDDMFKIYKGFDGAIGKFYLVDNRGYDYSFGHDIFISKELARQLHIRQIMLTGLVFLYSILDPRSFEGGAKSNLDTADLLVGKMPPSQTVLATTFWDLVGEDIGMTHQKRLKASVRLMTNTSGQVFRQDKGRESARAIIEYLVQNRTTAGRSVNRFIEGKTLSKTDTDGGNNAKPTPKSYQDKMNLPASQTGQESNTKFLEGKAQPDRRLANEARSLYDIAATIGIETKWSSEVKHGRKQRSQEVWDERTNRDERAKAEEPRMGELVREEVEELDMRQESTSMPFYPPTDSSPRGLGYLLWKLRNFTRPRLAQGFRRIEWLCDCGEIQYGDFDNTDPDAVSLLQASLQRPTVAPNSGHTPIPATQTSTQPTPPVTTQPKYLELCINYGKFERRLGEVDVSNITSDGQLFRQIKKTYDTVRGYRTKWFLLEPINIQFVEFGLEERHRVIIYPGEGSWPPPSAVAAGEWEYECPPRPPPPIPAHYFLHLMLDKRPHPRGYWMLKLPKKLGKSMMSEPGGLPTGWGVHIVEGLNQRVVAQIFLYFTVAVVIVSLFWSLWKRDLQGGMGLGSFALAGAVLLGFALQVEFYGQLADFSR